MKFDFRISHSASWTYIMKRFRFSKVHKWSPMLFLLTESRIKTSSSWNKFKNRPHSWADTECTKKSNLRSNTCETLLTVDVIHAYFAIGTRCRISAVHGKLAQLRDIISKYYRSTDPSCNVVSIHFLKILLDYTIAENKGGSCTQSLPVLRRAWRHACSCSENTICALCR